MYAEQIPHPSLKQPSSMSASWHHPLSGRWQPRQFVPHDTQRGRGSSELNYPRRIVHTTIWPRITRRCSQNNLGVLNMRPSFDDGRNPRDYCPLAAA